MPLPRQTRETLRVAPLPQRMLRPRLRRLVTRETTKMQPMLLALLPTLQLTLRWPALQLILHNPPLTRASRRAAMQRRPMHRPRRLRSRQSRIRQRETSRPRLPPRVRTQAPAPPTLHRRRSQRIRPRLVARRIRPHRRRVTRETSSRPRTLGAIRPPRTLRSRNSRRNLPRRTRLPPMVIRRRVQVIRLRLP